MTELSLSMWHVLLLFAVLQSVFLAVALCSLPTPRRAPNRLLSGLLLSCAALLAEYCLIDTGGFRSAPNGLGFSAPALFALGPLYYQYTRTLLQAPYRRGDLKHFVPAALVAVALLPFYVGAGADKAERVESLLRDGFLVFPMAEYLLVSLASFQLLAYFFRAYEFLQSFERSIVEEFASPRIRTIIWLKRLSLAFSVFMVLFYIAWGEALYPHDREQLVLPAAVTLLAGLILSVGLALFLSPELFAKYSHGNLPSPDAIPTPPKYEKTALTAAQMTACGTRLRAYLASHRPYLNGELRLSELAAAIGVPPHHLSQTINHALGMSYFELMNRHRVAAAKALLAASATSARTILDIALRAGFGSKASFNRIFKRHTGLTPTEYQAAKPAAGEH